jgi:hypothetical protein
MVDEGSEFASRSAIVVSEKASSRNFLFGFLTLMFGLALVRGHSGAETDLGRTVVDVVFGLLLLGTLGLWFWLHRHPAHIGISREAIILWHRGAKRPIEIRRAEGDLYIRYSGGRHPQPYLHSVGGEAVLALVLFDQRELVEACVASGWHFVNPNG